MGSGRLDAARGLLRSPRPGHPRARLPPDGSGRRDRRRGARRVRARARVAPAAARAGGAPVVALRHRGARGGHPLPEAIAPALAAVHGARRGPGGRRGHAPVIGARRGAPRRVRHPCAAWTPKSASRWCSTASRVCRSRTPRRRAACRSRRSGAGWRAGRRSSSRARGAAPRWASGSRKAASHDRTSGPARGCSAPGARRAVPPFDEEAGRARFLESVRGRQAPRGGAGTSCWRPRPRWRARSRSGGGVRMRPVSFTTATGEGQAGAWLATSTRERAAVHVLRGDRARDGRRVARAGGGPGTRGRELPARARRGPRARRAPVGHELALPRRPLRSARHGHGARRRLGPGARAVRRARGRGLRRRCAARTSASLQSRAGRASSAWSTCRRERRASRRSGRTRPQTPTRRRRGRRRHSRAPARAACAPRSTPPPPCAGGRLVDQARREGRLRRGLRGRDERRAGVRAASLVVRRAAAPRAGRAPLRSPRHRARRRS